VKEANTSDVCPATNRISAAKGEINWVKTVSMPARSLSLSDTHDEFITKIDTRSSEGEEGVVVRSSQGDHTRRFSSHLVSNTSWPGDIENNQLSFVATRGSTQTHVHKDATYCSFIVSQGRSLSLLCRLSSGRGEIRLQIVFPPPPGLHFFKASS